VREIQRQQVRELLEPDRFGNYKKYYLDIYRQVRSEIDHPLSILEFFDHPAVDDLKPFFRHVGENWLRIKEAAVDLSDYEKKILDGPGEKLLQHIEQELNPQKTYKMAVLYSLIEKDADSGGWDIYEIAKDFKNFYMQNRRYQSDYPAISREKNPEMYPLSKVRTHIINMPLNFLSDKDHKFFILEKEANRFYLKEGENGYLHRLWNDWRFKEQVRDRITFALKTYFYKKKN
jgi:hypothetical protein